MTAVPAEKACPTCGSPALFSERFRPVSLRSCTACGLLFRAEYPAEATARQLYTDGSYAAERMDAHTRRRHHDAEQRARWTRARVSGRRMLEVGAGTGFFVAHAGRHGFDVIGIEPSDQSAQYARSELGADVRTGFLDTVELPADAFDAVCLWHVLEHAADPLGLLQAIRERLRPGGCLVMEVPNVDSIGADMLRGRWAHLDPGAHVCHFAPRSLTVALERAGFAVVELQTLIEGYYDDRTMRLRPRRLVGRVVRGVRLRTFAPTHPTRGELLRVAASRAP